MRTCLFVLFATAACSAGESIILNIPSVIVPPSSSPTDISLDVGFVLTAPDVSQQLIAYDLYPIVTGGDGLSITGVGTGSDRPPNTVFDTDPFYNAASVGFRTSLRRGRPERLRRQPLSSHQGPTSAGRDRHVPYRCVRQ